MDDTIPIWTQESLEDYLKSTKSVFDTMTPLEREVYLYGSWEASEEVVMSTPKFKRKVKGKPSYWDTDQIPYSYSRIKYGVSKYINIIQSEPRPNHEYEVFIHEMGLL
jgi:hypothetical protein